MTPHTGRSLIGREVVVTVDPVYETLQRKASVHRPRKPSNGEPPTASRNSVEDLCSPHKRTPPNAGSIPVGDAT